MDRGVRTVQRWEHELQLPVHRIGKGRRSPVYALIPELHFWMSTTGVARKPEDPQSRLLQFPSTSPKSAQESRRLLVNMQTLARSLAEASVRQRRQAELLQKKIVEMKARIK